MSKKIVVMEIGHRQPDPGAVSGGLRETDLNLTAGLECKRQLERHGLTVFINRTEWAGMSLTDFYAQAAGMNPVAGCAFHWNAGGGNGWETYTQTSGMRAESVKLNQAIAEEMKAITVMRPTPVRNFDTHPTPNGANITRNINSIPAPFAYLENGFVDNATDRARFDTPEKQKQYGVQAARGILKYLVIAWVDEGSGGTDVPSNTPNPPADNTSGLTSIADKAVATVEQMTAYIKRINPNAPDLAALFISEGEIEGIRGDIAFAQSCLETGNFAFSGGTAVTLDQNNFCGMGVVQLGVKGISYKTPQDGIRAQIQHLKAYANELPLVNPIVIPTIGEARFRFVQRGVAPYVEWLGQQENPQGRGWATGAGYGAKILNILSRILETTVSTTPSIPTPTPTPTAKFKEGETVEFTGGGVYKTSVDTIPVHSRGKSRSKITRPPNSNRNPYHLESEDGGGVHGWVEAGDVQAFSGTAPAPAVDYTSEVNRIAADIWAGRRTNNGQLWGNNPQRSQNLVAHGNKTFGNGKGTQFATDVQNRVNATDSSRK